MKGPRLLRSEAGGGHGVVTPSTNGAVPTPAPRARLDRCRRRTHASTTTPTRSRRGRRRGRNGPGWIILSRTRPTLVPPPSGHAFTSAPRADPPRCAVLFAEGSSVHPTQVFPSVSPRRETNTWVQADRLCTELGAGGLCRRRPSTKRLWRRTTGPGSAKPHLPPRPGPCNSSLPHHRHRPTRRPRSRPRCTARRLRPDARPVEAGAGLSTAARAPRVHTVGMVPVLLTGRAIGRAVAARSVDAAPGVRMAVPSQNRPLRPARGVRTS